MTYSLSQAKACKARMACKCHSTNCFHLYHYQFTLKTPQSPLPQQQFSKGEWFANVRIRNAFIFTISRSHQRHPRTNTILRLILLIAHRTKATLSTVMERNWHPRSPMSLKLKATPIVMLCIAMISICDRTPYIERRCQNHFELCYILSVH